MVTTGFAWSIGDFTCQKYIEKHDVDYKRLLKMMLVGGCFNAVFADLYYRKLFVGDNEK